MRRVQAAVITSRRDLLRGAGLIAMLGFGLEINLRAADIGTALSRAQRTTLKTLADTILPPTDTPGAIDVGVMHFFEFIVRRGMDEPVHAAFCEGLKLLRADARRHLGTHLETASLQHRFAYIDSIDRELFDQEFANPERKSLLDCYATVKRLTVIGFYTSDAGAHSELHVEAFPGPFVGSVQLGADERTFYEDSFGVPVERPVGYLRRYE